MYRRLLGKIVLFFTIIGLSGCQSDGIVTLVQLATIDVSEVTESSALSGGIVRSGSVSTITASGVCWTTDAQKDPTIENSKSSDLPSGGRFASRLTDLSPGTTYYLRAYATNSAGTAYGNKLSFTTEGFALITDAPTEVMMTSAKFSGLINTNTNGSDITERGFCYSSKVPLPTILDSKVILGEGKGAFSTKVTLLEKGKLHYVRTYALIGNTVFYGNTQSFTTGDGVMRLTTTNATSITYNSAVVGGTIDSDGGCVIVSRGVCYGESSNPTIANAKVLSTATTSSYTVNLSSLTRSKTYYARAFVTNDQGATAYGDNVVFLTVDGLPVLEKVTDYYIGSFSLLWGFRMTNAGAVPITDKGVCYSNTPNPTISGQKVSKGAGGVVNTVYPIKLPNLHEQQTYYARPYVTSSLGTVYGESITFNTPKSEIRGYSNAYIVAPNVTIQIPVGRASQAVSGAIKSTDILTADLVWTDHSGRLSAGSNLADIGVRSHGSNGHIYVSTGVSEGNGVVSVKVGGVIKWSWHIWVTNYDPKNDFITLPAGAQAMDRNLGALTASYSGDNTRSMGLLYQWGRKDPFAGSANWSGAEPVLYTESGTTTISKAQTPTSPNLLNSIKTPLTLYFHNNGDWYAINETALNNQLWTSSKTIYDPCPEGWKVPSKSAFQGVLAAGFGWNTHGRILNSGNSFFPAAGLRENGVLKNVGGNGEYWTSTASVPNVDVFQFDSGAIYDKVTPRRCDAMSIRCVKE